MDDKVSSRASVDVVWAVDKTELLDDGDVKSMSHRGSQVGKTGRWSS